MAEGPYYATYSTSSTTTYSGSIGSTVLNSLGLKSIADYSATNTDAEIVLRPGSNSLIDVVNDFAWTASPTTKSKLKIPYLYATELRQEQNSLVTSALYYINSINNSTIATDAVSFIAGLLGEKAGNALTGFLSTFKKNTSSLVSGGADSSLLKTYLQSYVGMYLTKTTGFKYAFPFFEGKPHNITNSWRDSQQIKPVYGVNEVEKVMGAMDSVAATINIFTPGTYIEKPKYFSYPTEGESISLSLPLINTIQKGSKLPYQQNYELLWILAFQNKPYRTSFSRILPPKLYKINIPGMKYFPYAYISSMNVEFLGTRRQLEVNTPLGAVTTSIPEAYMLNLTFTSLLADTGNLMATEGFRSNVKVETVK